MSLPIELWTDGSSLSNPGPSGWAYICQYTPTAKDDEMPISVKIEKSQGYRLSTNNRMEMMAIIHGVTEAIKCIDTKLSDSKAIITFSDSQYCINAISMRWLANWQKNNWVTKTGGMVKNKDLWEEIIEVIKTAEEKGIVLNWKWVKGHADNDMNNRADQLAVAASNNASAYLVDEEYEKLKKK